MSVFDVIGNLLHREGSPLLEMHLSEKNPIGVRVDAYEWSNPEVLKPGGKNPFILQLTVTLGSASPMNVESLAVDLGKSVVVPLEFEPITIAGATTVTPRFEIPYAAAVRPLGPALLITADGGGVTRTKRFRVPAVPT